LLRTNKRFVTTCQSYLFKNMTYGANTIGLHDFHNVNNNMTLGCKYEVRNKKKQKL